MQESNRKGISIIVCCYNSAKRLPETLKHLSMQDVPAGIAWEIIVVDNNSTDNTAEHASAIWNSFQNQTPFKIIKEDEQGLSYARNKGANEAQFEYLLFCDDDNWLDAHYVHYAYTIMSTNENIGVLGGRSAGAYETEKPEWFDRFGQAYAIGRPAKSTGIVNARTYIAGAGMVVRKSVLQVLENLSFKQLVSDRKGNELISGGDAELCLLIMFLGYDLYYDERLQFKHFLPANRLEWKYCVSMMAKGHAIPQLYLEFYNYCSKKITTDKKKEFKNAYKLIVKKITKKLLKNFISTKPFWLPPKLLLRSEPGSRKEIELKANLNKLSYLLRHKKNLKKDFYIICELMQNIFRCKNAVDSQYVPLSKV